MVRRLLDLAVFLAAGGLIVALGGGLALRACRQQRCANLTDAAQALDCRYLEAALLDHAAPSDANLGARLSECQDYAAKATRYAELPIAEARDKARRYVEGCARTRGGL